MAKTAVRVLIAILGVVAVIRAVTLGLALVFLDAPLATRSDAYLAEGYKAVPAGDPIEIVSESGGFVDDGVYYSVDTIVARTGDGDLPLFRVQKRNHELTPRIARDGRTVVVWYDGRVSYDSDGVFEAHGVLIFDPAYYSPEMYIYDLTTGKLTDVALGIRDLALLDVFILDGRVYFAGDRFDSLIKSGKGQLFTVTDGEASVAADLPGSIVSKTPLFIEGTLRDGRYDYPAKDGVYSIDLSDGTVEKRLDIDLSGHSRAYLRFAGDRFFLAEELETEGGLSRGGANFVSVYDSEFRLIERTEFETIEMCLHSIGGAAE